MAKRGDAAGGVMATVYVTYDLSQTEPGETGVMYRGAKRILIPGRVFSWEVGEFKIHEVEDVCGVRIRYWAEKDRTPQEELVPVSKYAQNVQVFVDSLPREYESGLKSAA